VKSCRIEGPGTITGSLGFGVGAILDDLQSGAIRVKIANGVIITGNGGGVATVAFNDSGKLAGVVTVQDSEITGNAGPGVKASRSIKVFSSIVSGNDGAGIGQVGLSGNAGTLKIIVKDSVIMVNGEEGVIAAGNAKIVRSTVADNGIHGVSVVGGQIRASKSTMTGNGTDASCGVTQTCADVASRAGKTRLDKTSTCGASYELLSGFPGTSLGVCSLD